LKELEVQKKQAELANQKQELAQKSSWLARWNNPVVLAILAGLAGYLGTLVTWSLARMDEANRHARTLELEQAKQQATENLERQKLAGTLILDAMKTGEGPDHSRRAAANLVLLADAKLVSFDEDALSKLKSRAGDVGPGLPSPVRTSSVEPLDFGPDEYVGRDRGKAKTSIAAGPIKAYESLGDLLDELPSDTKMLTRDPPLKRDTDFDRVPEENRNVTIRGWLYAAKKEADNDFHLIVGTDPSKESIRYMTMEITGLPTREPDRAKLQVPREAFKQFLRDHQVRVISIGYIRFEPPVPVRITGSLFYDLDHPPGAVGPRDLRARTSWEVHPITEIAFEH
jgi:hypothetical protein